MNSFEHYAILVIDDEKNALTTFKHQFKNLVTVLTAASGKEALNTLRTYKDKEIAVVIVDQRMPEMTGLELMLQFKKEFPHIVRVLFTGYSDTKVIESIVNQAGIFKYIHKPYQEEHVEPVIKESLQKYGEEKEKIRYLNQTMLLIQEKTAKAMENYTSWIAHHVNNTLQTITTFVDIAGARLDKDETEKNFAKMTKDYVRRLGDIVKNLHAIYSDSLEHFVKVPVQTLLQFENTIIEKKVKDKKISIKKEIRNPGLEIMANPMAIQEAIRRLVENSLEASKEGGEVEVSIAKMLDEEVIVVRVHDSGCGIPDEIKDKLFFPFLKLGSNSQTMKGLGLAYVQATVARHGGDIMVESNANTGTTITFTLPIIQAEKNNSDAESLDEIKKMFGK